MGSIVWLASYPSSGSTWVRVLLKNIFDPSAGPVRINALDANSLANRLWLDDRLGLDTADMSLAELRALRSAAQALIAGGGGTFVKTHESREQADILAAHTKAILYVVRNPLDVCHSYAAHMGCDLDQAIDCMADPQHALSEQQNLLRPNLRQHIGSWSDHVKGWLATDEVPCICIRYEDLHLTAIATLDRVMRGIGHTASRSDLQRAYDNSRFGVLAAQEADAGFREKPSTAERFFRHGQAGRWRELLTPDMVRRVTQHHGGVMRRLGYLSDDEAPDQGVAPDGGLIKTGPTG